MQCGRQSGAGHRFGTHRQGSLRRCNHAADRTKAKQAPNSRYFQRRPISATAAAPRASAQGIQENEEAASVFPQAYEGRPERSFWREGSLGRLSLPSLS